MGHVGYNRIQDPEVRYLAEIAESKLIDLLALLDGHVQKTPERKKEFLVTYVEFGGFLFALLDLVFAGLSKTRLTTQRAVETEL